MANVEPVAQPERGPAAKPLWLKRAIFVFLPIVILGGLAWATWSSLSRGTLVTPHAKAPIPHGRNVLWRATAQLAWDRAAEAAGTKGLDVRGAADAAGVDALNADPFPLADLDPKSFVAMGGTGGSRVSERFRDALVANFGAVPADVMIPDVGPGKAGAFAYLLKEMRFRVAFDLCPSGLSFRTGPMPILGRTRVQAFGFEGPHHSQAPTDLDAELRASNHALHERLLGGSSSGVAALAQVRLHWQDDPRDPNRFIIELRPESRDRILLARVDPESTLQKTWEAVSRLAAGDGRPLPAFERFEIPKIDIGKQATSFRDLRGTIRRPSPPDWYLEEFSQWTGFRLDERGARLESFGGITMSQGMGDGPRPTYPSYVFDRPFLLALVERGATRPYFLLWIGNADLLVKMP